MNRYTYTNIKDLSILERMALLREQRNLIKAVHCIHEDDSIAQKEDRIKVQAFLGLASDAEILAHIKKYKILLSDKKGGFPTKLEDKGHFGRTSKIAVVFQACLDSGYLTPVVNMVKKDDDKMIYYRISNAGSDLLHPLGFIQIAFDKYSKIIIFFWGVLSIIALKALTWVFANWQAIKTSIFS